MNDATGSATSERDRFTCALCKGTFDKAWSDEEALAEADELWGGMPTDAAVVCDDCFVAMGLAQSDDTKEVS